MPIPIHSPPTSLHVVFGGLVGFMVGSKGGGRSKRDCWNVLQAFQQGWFPCHTHPSAPFKWLLQNLLFHSAHFGELSQTARRERRSFPLNLVKWIGSSKQGGLWSIMVHMTSWTRTNLHFFQILPISSIQYFSFSTPSFPSQTSLYDSKEVLKPHANKERESYFMFYIWGAIILFIKQVYYNMPYYCVTSILKSIGQC